MIRTLIIMLLLPAVFTAKRSFGQISPDSIVTIHISDTPFVEALAIIESRTGLRFNYDPRSVQGQPHITLDLTDVPVGKMLEVVFRGRNLSFSFIGLGVVIRRESPAEKITISGFVKDSMTNERLIGANIFLPDRGIGIATNSSGFFSITTAAADSISLVISYIGYRPVLQTIPAHGNVSLTVNASRNAQDEAVAPAAVIVDPRENNVKRNQASIVDLSAEMLTTAPSYTSSGDLINSVQLLPGVQTGVDGTAGYSVRGGNTGQNIVLVNDAPVYNPSHLFGLASIFNPDAVKYASFLKGGFPASYGDHLSSVLDVSMKDGNGRRFGGSGQLGNITSGISLNGPLSPRGSSWFIAARRSTIDLWLQPLSAGNYFRNYYFYDLNGSLNLSLGAKDRLLLSFYNGRDNNNYSDVSSGPSGIAYSTWFGNFVTSLRWDHQWSPKLYGNTTLMYTDYRQFISATEQGYFAQIYSGIRNLGGRTGLNWYFSPSHKVSAGADLLFQTLYPALLSNRIPAGGENPITPSTIPPQNAWRLAAFAGDDIRTGARTRLYLGIRFSADNSLQASYANAEPRLSFLYLFNDATSFKASYSRVAQYLHLVQSYNASFPAEVWIGSDAQVLPEVGDELSAGLFRNFASNSIQTSVEVYYKNLYHQLLFKGSTTPVIDNGLQNNLIFGRGYAYGAEWIIRKNRGRWKGWLSYTFGYSWQQFDSLNQGTQFPFALDRRSNLSISSSYAIDRHWKASGAFYFATGRAFTLNNGTIPPSNPLYGDDITDDNGQPQPSASQPANNYRLNPYDRLDLSVSYHKINAKGHFPTETVWSLTLYNVYARSNTEFAYRTIDPINNRSAVRQVSFLPVIPCLNYSVSF